MSQSPLFKFFQLILQAYWIKYSWVVLINWDEICPLLLSMSQSFHWRQLILHKMFHLIQRPHILLSVYLRPESRNGLRLLELQRLYLREVKLRQHLNAEILRRLNWISMVLNANYGRTEVHMVILGTWKSNWFLRGIKTVLFVFSLLKADTS